MKLVPRMNAQPKSNVGREKPAVGELAASIATSELIGESYPNNVYAERTILGAVLLDEKAFTLAEDSLQVEDFSLDSHRVIWKRMATLHANGSAIDIVTLANELGRNKEVEFIGGVAYLASLTEGLPRRPAIDDYIRIVANASLLRKYITIAESAIAKAENDGRTAAELIGDTTAQLLDAVSQSKVSWRIASKRELLVGAGEFLLQNSPETEWTVKGLIQRGGNGIIVGDPGATKSLLAYDLLLHLVAGCDWLGCKVPKRMRCALVSREDHPGLTSQRGQKLIDGLPTDVFEALREVNINEWFYLNTRAQTETLSLQKESDVQEIIEEFKAKKIEFAVFDVFRRLWDGDENDNQAVANVLAVLTRIQTECDCSVVLVHHLNKGDGSANIFNRIRGASSIYGWREWAFGITVENPEAEPRNRIRKIVFETKADTASDPIYYRISGFAEKIMVENCDAPPRAERKSKSKTVVEAEKPEDQASLFHKSKPNGD